MSNEVMENEEKEKLLNLAEEKKYRQLKEALLEINEVDIASFMEELDSEKTVIVFRMLPKALATDVFAELPAESRATSSTASPIRSFQRSWRTCMWTTRWICWRSFRRRWCAAF